MSEEAYRAYLRHGPSVGLGVTRQALQFQDEAPTAAHLLTLERELGASLHEAPAYATTLALSALCDIVEEQNHRIAKLEERIDALTAR